MAKHFKEGPAKNELLASIEKRTLELAEHDNLTQGKRWKRRAIKTAIALVVALVVATFCTAVTVKHTRIANGHPEIPFVGGWVLATEFLFQGVDLSPRGNPMPKANQLVEVKGNDPRTGDRDFVFFTFKLARLSYVKGCGPDVPDLVPHPKNGQFILLEFDVTGGELDFASFAKKEFFAETLDGKKTDIGTTSGLS